MARNNNLMDIGAFQLSAVPADFFDDPYRYYAALRERDPLHALDGGGVLLTRYEDAVAVYRDARASSDKKIEFKPKFGDSPLYEHHTTSLVFNDPPLAHARAAPHHGRGQPARHRADGSAGHAARRRLAG